MSPGLSPSLDEAWGSDHYRELILAPADFHDRPLNLPAGAPPARASPTDTLISGSVSRRSGYEPTAPCQAFAGSLASHHTERPQLQTLQLRGGARFAEPSQKH